MDFSVSPAEERASQSAPGIFDAGVPGACGQHSPNLGWAGLDGAEFWASGFRLMPAQRRLERDGMPVAIGAKAFDVLTILVSRAGEVVEKAELLERVWRGRVAEEGSLRFHIKALRSALGDSKLVTNVAGQGYCFVGEVSQGPPASPPAPNDRPSTLPRLPRLVGRDEVLDGIAAQIFDRRFITIVGPGGIGKTSVAVAIGRRLAGAFDGDVCFFDVAGHTEPHLFFDGLALALGLPLQTTGAPPNIAACLLGRRLLLILDGCEPAVETAAAMAEQLVHEAPGVHIIATSREALRAEAECVCRLRPLSYPREEEALSASQVMAFPAVRLFVERAEASLPGFKVTDENAAIVAAVCRKLDGLPLAVEVAAGRVEAHGIGEIARQLESQFALRWPGRRTAITRHQTLNAALDWSHALLSDAERIWLRRISVFPGGFTLDMAIEVATGRKGVVDADPVDVLGSLVAKSLVQCEQVGSGATYRLLDTTRDYARQKLCEAGELAATTATHSALVLALVERRAVESDVALGGLQRADLLANVRAALKAVLHEGGDGEIAATLTAAAAPNGLQSRQLMGCYPRPTQALDTIDPLVGGYGTTNLRLADQVLQERSRSDRREGLAPPSMVSQLPALRDDAVLTLDGVGPAVRQRERTAA